MTTHSGTYAAGDFDGELDAYADLWLKAHEAAAIKDPTSPAAAEAHAVIDGLLDDLGL